jgi:hypothetical protein
MSTLVTNSYYLCYFGSFQVNGPNFEQALSLYESIVTGQQIELKRAAIMATSLIHRQIMSSFVHLLLKNVTSNVYPEVASALTVILQNPVSLQALGDGNLPASDRFPEQIAVLFRGDENKRHTGDTMDISVI